MGKKDKALENTLQLLFLAMPNVNDTFTRKKTKTIFQIKVSFFYCENCNWLPDHTTVVTKYKANHER